MFLILVFHKSKHDFLLGNCINEPLITVDSDVPLISYVPVPELHILIGVTTSLYQSLDKEDPQLAHDWLEQLNIQLSHRGQFNGNGARQLLKSAGKLEVLNPGSFSFCLFLHTPRIPVVFTGSIETCI